MSEIILKGDFKILRILDDRFQILEQKLSVMEKRLDEIQDTWNTWIKTNKVKFVKEREGEHG